MLLAKGENVRVGAGILHNGRNLIHSFRMCCIDIFLFTRINRQVPNDSVLTCLRLEASDSTGKRLHLQGDKVRWQIAICLRQIGFRHNRKEPGSSYLVEFSDDLIIWDEAPDGEAVPASADATTTFTVFYDPATPVAKRFFRVTKLP